MIRGAAMRHARGFTLLEVVVALAVISLALLALVRTAGLGAQALAHETDLTFANWVAANVIGEVRLRERFPPLGRRDGVATMGPLEFRWELVVQATEEPAIRRLDVRVFDARKPDAGSLTGMTGFAGKR